MTDLKYIGETGRRFIMEVKDGDTHIGYAALIKADMDDVRKLLEEDKMVNLSSSPGRSSFFKPHGTVEDGANDA